MRESDPLPEGSILERQLAGRAHVRRLMTGAADAGRWSTEAHIVAYVSFSSSPGWWPFFGGPVAEPELSSKQDMNKRVPLGELLMNAGLVTPAELDAALREQQGSELRLGVILARRGLVSETQVTQILSQQLSVPWVSLHHIAFPPELLGRVPSELARRHRLVPVYVRRVRRVGEILYLAMEDPEDDLGLSQVEQFAGSSVKPMIASPSDITRTLVEYYGLSPPPVEAPAKNPRAPTKRRDSALAPERTSLALQVQLTLSDGSTMLVPINGMADPCATLLEALQNRQVITGWCFSNGA